jgi:hypothetical protein
MLYTSEQSTIKTFHFHTDRVTHYNRLIAEIEAKISAAEARQSKPEKIDALHMEMHMAKEWHEIHKEG